MNIPLDNWQYPIQKSNNWRKKIRTSSLDTRDKFLLLYTNLYIYLLLYLINFMVYLQLSESPKFCWKKYFYLLLSALFEYNNLHFHSEIFDFQEKLSLKIGLSL